MNPLQPITDYFRVLSLLTEWQRYRLTYTRGSWVPGNLQRTSYQQTDVPSRDTPPYLFPDAPP